MKDRFPILAICLLLVVGCVVLGWQYQCQNKEVASNKHSPMEQTVDNVQPLLPGGNVERSPTDGAQRQPENKKSAVAPVENAESLQVRDHRAQIQMANAAWFGIGLGLLGTMLIGWTLKYTRDAAGAAIKTLAEAEKATKAALRSVESDRAWVGQHDFQVRNVNDWSDGKKRTGSQIAFIWKNFGGTPAINVSTIISYRIIDARGDVPNVVIEPIPHAPTGSIFPSQSEQSSPLKIFDPELSLLLERAKDLYVFGTVFYNTIYSSKVETASFTYKVLLQASSSLDTAGNRTYHTTMMHV